MTHRPRAADPDSLRALGNLLQRLAFLAPDKMAGIQLIVQATLREAEATYRRRFRRDPWANGGPLSHRWR